MQFMKKCINNEKLMFSEVIISAQIDHHQLHVEVKALATVHKVLICD
jgi:hypothetical protein